MATSNAGRERILNRLRRAQVKEIPASAQATVFAPIGNIQQRFLAECEANLTRVHRTNDFS